LAAADVIRGINPSTLHTQYTAQELLKLKQNLRTALDEVREQNLFDRTGDQAVQQVVTEVLGAIDDATKKIDHYISAQQIYEREQAQQADELERKRESPMLDMVGAGIEVGWHGLYVGVYPGLSQDNPLYVLADVIVIEIYPGVAESNYEKSARIRVKDIRVKGKSVNLEVGEELVVSGIYLGDVEDVLIDPSKRPRREYGEL